MSTGGRFLTSTERTERRTVTLAYSGPAVASGSMDAQELGPALVAVADLCQEATRLINGDRGGFLGYATWRKYLALAHGFTAAH